MIKKETVLALFSGLPAIISGRGLKSELVRNGISSLILRAAYILLSFFITVLLARTLGTEGYGVYTYVFALVFLFSIPSEFGLPQLVIRETAKALAGQDWSVIQGVWQWSGVITAALSGVLALGAGVAVLVWGTRFSSQQITTFYWSLVLIPLVALGDLRGAALRGLNRVIQGQLPEQLIRPGFYVFLVFLTIFLFPSENFTPAVAMALQVLAAALAFLIGAWLLWRATPLMVRQAKPVYESRRWFSSTLPLAFTSGMGVINSYTSIITLGFFVTSPDVGIYRVADQMALLVSISLQAINMVVAPQFARLHALGEKTRLQRLATASARVVLVLTLPVVIGFLWFGKQLLQFAFGIEFVPAYGPLAILALGQLVNSAMGSVGFLLNMTGYEQDTALGMTVSAIGNLALNLVLIPFWGVIGAALASAISMVIWNVLLWAAVRRRLGINSMAFGN